MAADNPKDKPQIFPNPYVTFCDVFNCTTRAKWFVGRPDAPYTTCLNLCDECAKEVLRLIPPELLEFVPVPEGTVLIDADELAELRQNVENLKAELEDMYKDNEFEFGPSTLPPQEKTEPEPVIYACNFPGCDKGPFKTPQALLAHSRVHK